MDRPNRLLDAQELADHYGVSRAHIYNQMKRGLPSVKIGRCRRFALDACDAWLAGEVTPRDDAA